MKRPNVFRLEPHALQCKRTTMNMSAKVQISEISVSARHVTKQPEARNVLFLKDSSAKLNVVMDCAKGLW